MSEVVGSDCDALEAEWRGVHDSVVAVGAGMVGQRDCAQAATLMERVEITRAALEEVVHGLQKAHLVCCVLPHVGASAELVLALARLSHRRVGALIAIEQQGSLAEYAARGTPVDARVSANLLESLFHPGGTLHDGAVIVRDGRIMAAGVFLPLATERREADAEHHLGARHRAALGLSRICDAAVLVVSEETGEVSLALRGLFHRGVPLAGEERATIAPDDGAAPPSARVGPWGRLRRLMGR